MNYFEFYSLPVSFITDKESIKEKFLQKSREVHPDFFVNKAEAEQQDMLVLSTLNTKAFETLTDFDRRLKYILELKGLIAEGEKNTLPPEFLMEMMEVNETLADLSSNPDEEKITAIAAHIAETEEQLYEGVKPDLENYTDAAPDAAALNRIKDYYHKRRYLLRIKQSLDTFAAH